MCSCLLGEYWLPRAHLTSDGVVSHMPVARDNCMHILVFRNLDPELMMVVTRAFGFQCGSRSSQDHAHRYSWR